MKGEASYNVVIKVYLPNYVEFPASKNLTTEGEVTINMEVIHTTNVIVLNMKNIILFPDQCEARSGRIRLTITNINIEDQFDRVTFTLSETLHIGQEVSLKVTYSGKINDKLDGLYQTTYTDSQGNPKIAVVSKCEPMSARMIVPCLDEPEYKAIWNVTIIHPNGTTAIANALELNETSEPNGLWKVSRFHPTPILASYLIALFVSEFGYEESFTKRGVRFRVWSTPMTREQRSYGVKAAVTFMEFFEEYVGVQDIVMKQDLVALPDFSSGAMENWGLVTFRESLLLGDGLPKPDRLSPQQIIIAHELAHQWFGNMVTLKGWEDLWLNEGFANYFENVMPYEKKDRGLTLSSRGARDFERALQADSFASSRPLSSVITSTSEVYETFDSISYDKGSAVIAMTVKIIGKQQFRKGVHHYIEKFSLRNAKGDDWWKSLDEVLNSTRKGPDGGMLKMWYFGSQWTKQMGFPLVTVETMNSTTIKIDQQRFLIGPYTVELLKYRSPSYGYKWDVPLFYQVGRKKVGFKWLKRGGVWRGFYTFHHFAAQEAREVSRCELTSRLSTHAVVAANVAT
ncbi:hypothetical protein Y032_0021g376 [Ancylostoma ceylanicum]|uniref:Uncharacterized protein n=1 Tax=Ancylostoma ceylanicum TaxID=53326 RepID=A0A016V116_9BILA|nr:hypothetical protein Y032_0021g376 [Ancylostoma ceylanicum]